MFVSNILSCFSSDNIDDESIPYYTDTSLQYDASYTFQLDAICQFNYDTCQGVVHLTCFLLQDLKPNFRKLQFQAFLKPIQQLQELQRKQTSLEIHQLLWLGKG